MHGVQLKLDRKEAYMRNALESLDILRHRGLTTFVSFEPLSWDVSPVIGIRPMPSWAIIGAGSNGPRKVQPDPEHVRRLLYHLDVHHVPVFMKENLIWDPIRREFPAQEKGW
jgi:protein gp37